MNSMKRVLEAVNAMSDGELSLRVVSWVCAQYHS